MLIIFLSLPLVWSSCGLLTSLQRVLNTVSECIWWDKCLLVLVLPMFMVLKPQSGASFFKYFLLVNFSGVLLGDSIKINCTACLEVLGDIGPKAGSKYIPSGFTLTDINKACPLSSFTLNCSLFRSA